MEIFSELNNNFDLSLALGYFDGVHKGHRSVIKLAVDYAKNHNTKSAVITFKDHPCCYFWGVCPKYILTREERRNKISELGVDYLYELDFKEFAKLSALEYLENILIKNFAPSAISTGFNHHFGADKSGNTDFLEKYSDMYGYKYFMAGEEKYLGETISSTTIRSLLANGDIIKSNDMLGYNFPLEGVVVKGRQIGRTIGFRTANIAYPSEIITLPFGAYSVRVKVGNVLYNGVTNFGIKPTVSNEKRCTVETHILDFDEDIYGENIRIEILNMIRPEMKFNSIEDLKLQIKNDVEFSKSH